MRSQVHSQVDTEEVFATDCRDEEIDECWFELLSGMMKEPVLFLLSLSEYRCIYPETGRDIFVIDGNSPIQSIKMLNPIEDIFGIIYRELEYGYFFQMFCCSTSRK